MVTGSLPPAGTVGVVKLTMEFAAPTAGASRHSNSSKLRSLPRLRVATQPRLTRRGRHEMLPAILSKRDNPNIERSFGASPRRSGRWHHPGNDKLARHRFGDEGV